MVKYVLFPFGYEVDVSAPDHTVLEKLAVSIASNIQNDARTGNYTPLRSCDFYPAAGDSDDWLYGNKGVLAYTIEMSSTFIPPGSSIENICERVWHGCKKIFKRLEGPLIYGNVYDKDSLIPLEVRITNNRVDTNQLTPRHSLRTTGEYHWILEKGEYLVTFSKSGYCPKTIPVTLTDSPVRKDIYMERLPDKFTWGIEPKVIPNPVKGTGYQTIFFNVLTENAEIRCKIHNISGDLIRDFPVKRSNGDPYHDRIFWDLKNDSGEDVSSGVYIAELTVSKGGGKLVKLMKLCVAR